MPAQNDDNDGDDDDDDDNNDDDDNDDDDNDDDDYDDHLIPWSIQDEGVIEGWTMRVVSWGGNRRMKPGLYLSSVIIIFAEVIIIISISISIKEEGS